MMNLITIGSMGGHVTLGTTESVDIPIVVAVGAYQSSITVADARLLARVLESLADSAELYEEVRRHNEGKRK